MDQSLKDAAQQGSINALYALILTDPQVLDRIDGIPFVETPLHMAASLGHTLFAMEVMQLKPSFGRKLNHDGFSPMHLALQKHHDSENDHALQRNLIHLVDRLLDVDKDLVRVRGREGETPLHYVAKIGNLQFLDKFVKGCPESLEDMTIRRENVLHIALKNDKVEAFWLLVRWLRWTSYEGGEKLLYREDYEGNILSPVDDEGNTLLHVAVSRNPPKACKSIRHLRIQSPKIVLKNILLKLSVVSWLLKRSFVDLKAKNLEGHTVFDILGCRTQVDNQRIRFMLRESCVTSLILSPFSIIGKLNKARRRQQRTITEDRRNALLVVAALLITVTYQAALGPDQQPNEFNCTAPTNATAANHFNCTARFNASREVDPSPHQGVAFYSINTLTYYLTNVTLLFLLPPDFIATMLYYLLGLLFLCYSISTPLLNAPLLSTVGVCLLLSFPIFGLLSIRPYSSDRRYINLPYFFLGVLSAVAIALKVVYTPVGVKLGFF